MRNKFFLLVAVLFFSILTTSAFYILQPISYVKSITINFPYTLVKLKNSTSIQKVYPLDPISFRKYLTSQNFLEEILSDKSLIQKFCYGCIRASYIDNNSYSVKFVITTNFEKDNRILSEHFKKKAITELNSILDKYSNDHIKPLLSGYFDTYNLNYADIFSEENSYKKINFRWDHLFILISTLIFIVFLFIPKKTVEKFKK